jgi:hypothetical protein
MLQVLFQAHSNHLRNNDGVCLDEKEEPDWNSLTTSLKEFKMLLDVQVKGRRQMYFSLIRIRPWRVPTLMVVLIHPVAGCGSDILFIRTASIGI